MKVTILMKVSDKKNCVTSHATAMHNKPARILHTRKTSSTYRLDVLVIFELVRRNFDQGFLRTESYC